MLLDARLLRMKRKAKLNKKAVCLKKLYLAGLIYRFRGLIMSLLDHFDCCYAQPCRNLQHNPYGQENTFFG